jgi:hypothetical protein
VRWRALAPMAKARPDPREQERRRGLVPMAKAGPDPLSAR